MINHEYTFHDIHSFFIAPLENVIPNGPNSTITLSNLNSQHMFSYNRFHVLPITYYSENTNSYGIDLHMGLFVLKVRFSKDSIYSYTMSLMALSDRIRGLN